MTRTEDDIIQGLIHREEKTVRYFVRQYQDNIYSLCLRILQQPDLAREACQDVLIQAIEKIKTFNREAKLSTWLYKIAYFKALEYHRREKRNLIDINDCVLAGKSNESLENAHQKFYLTRAIAQLDPRDALLVNLYYLEEMQIRDICKIVNESESNVKIRLFRSRKKLAEMLQNVSFENITAK